MCKTRRTSTYEEDAQLLEDKLGEAKEILKGRIDVRGHDSIGDLDLYTQLIKDSYTMLEGIDYMGVLVDKVFKESCKKFDRSKRRALL